MTSRPLSALAVAKRMLRLQILFLLGTLTFLNRSASAGEIHEAVKSGDAKRVSALIKADPKLLKSRDQDNRLPLLWAASYGHLEIVKILLDAGADVNAGNYRGTTALQTAASNGHNEVFKLLLANGAKPDQQNVDRWTALHYAASSSNIEATKILLRRRVDPNPRDKNGETPLIWAQTHLITFGVERNPQGHGKVYRGWETSFERFKKTADLLLAKGADINVSSGALLIGSIRAGQEDLVQYLLDEGADVSGPNPPGFWEAMYYANLKILRRLFATKKDIDAKDTRGRTLLHRAADGWQRIDSIPTPEEFLAEEEKLRTSIELLLENGAKIDAEDKTGDTPLLLAAKKGFINNSALLIRKGADSKRAVAKLESELSTLDHNRIRRTLRALKILGKDSAPAVPALSKLLKSLDSMGSYGWVQEYRNAGLEALQAIGTPAAAESIQRLKLTEKAGTK